MSVTISAEIQCLVPDYLQVFVRWVMSSLRYLSLLVYGDVQHILCCVFVCFICFRLVASFSGLSIFDCPFGIL